MTDTPSRADALAELGRIVLGEEPLEAVLERVALLARQLVRGADEISVTLVQGGAAETAAYTGVVAKDVDLVQYEHGDGPCLTAARTHEIVRVADFERDGRWPAVADAALRRGMHGVLSVGLPVRDRVIGALNMYSTGVDEYDDEDVEIAQTFAAHAAVALANATLYASATRLAEQMAEAMRSRAVIEQAKGILMAQRHCTADEAFEILTQASQRANKKLRDIAAAIVESTAREK